MRKLVLSVVIILTAAFFATSFISVSSAVPVGKVIEYKGGNMGTVWFDGRIHNEAGYHCLKCHNGIFVTQIGAAKITYEDHGKREKYCFACHNGREAFDAIGNCNLCHKS